MLNLIDKKYPQFVFEELNNNFSSVKLIYEDLSNLLNAKQYVYD